METGAGLHGSYDPAVSEPAVVERWLASGLFEADPDQRGDGVYSTPHSLPNVTGALHMGHALNASLRDTMVRYHRARGKKVAWIYGLDHAGIATQTKVEAQLRDEGTNRSELGRARFEQRVWRWCDEYGDTITKQLQRMGASIDYSNGHFTLDDDYSRAVTEVFARFYTKGFIYRDNYLINWDPGSGTAISNFEVVSREVTDPCYAITYILASRPGKVSVATIRPETLFGDTALAVHPEDARYSGLVGQAVVLPLVGREIPIIADERVDPVVGTGVIRVTPAHDPVGFEIGRDHGLEAPCALGEDGLMTAVADPVQGLDPEAARRAVLTTLRALGRVQELHPRTHTASFSERSGARIDHLVSLQWFLDLQELAPPAIAALEGGRVTIQPEPWQRLCVEWMRSPTPWCISRQLWWGHKLPIWYRQEEIHVGTGPPAGEGWERDRDVLDTWFSATLWPFACVGWPKRTRRFEAFYPHNSMFTARDIVLFWYPQMLMFALELTGEIPFRSVYVHPTIQSADGRRMSKSLGTGVNPVGEIEEYGSDAVRFGLLTMCSNQDVRYSSDKIRQGRKVASKLWNAARLMGGGGFERAESKFLPNALEDRWIISRLAWARSEFDRWIEVHDFPQAAAVVRDFVCTELCACYLELVKERLRSEDAGSLNNPFRHVLEQTLILVHPVLPFVTEEVWSRLGVGEGLLAARTIGPAGYRDEEAEQMMGWVTAVTSVVRSWRGVAGLPAGRRLRARFEVGDREEGERLVACAAWLELVPPGLDLLEPIKLAIPAGTLWVSFAKSADLPLEGEAADSSRRAKLEAAIVRHEQRLADVRFLSNAPESAIGAERRRLERQRERLFSLAVAS